MTANELNSTLLIEIPKAFPLARLWRNNRVNAMVTGRNGKPRMINAGIDGQGDLSGIFPTSVVCEGDTGPSTFGLRLEIETKTPRDKMSEAQKAFKSMILSAGGIYLEVRSVEQCLKDLEAYR